MNPSQSRAHSLSRPPFGWCLRCLCYWSAVLGREQWSTGPFLPSTHPSARGGFRNAICFLLGRGWVTIMGGVCACACVCAWMRVCLGERVCVRVAAVLMCVCVCMSACVRVCGPTPDQRDPPAEVRLLKTAGWGVLYVAADAERGLAGGRGAVSSFPQLEAGGGRGALSLHKTFKLFCTHFTPFRQIQAVYVSLRFQVK